VRLPLALTELGLIDEYEFVVHPRLAGNGPTLFAGLSKRVDLKLVSRLEFGSGAVSGDAVRAEKVAIGLASPSRRPCRKRKPAPTRRGSLLTEAAGKSQPVPDHVNRHNSRARRANWGEC